MAGLKEVRIRIASVKSTQQITNAMRMVAASKLRRAQNAIVRLRPYAAKLREIMQNLGASASETDSGIYAEERKPNRVLLVVLTSNRGLCGAFNTNVIKAAQHLLSETYAEQHRKEQLHLITIGRKASEFFRKRKFRVIASWDEIYDKLTFENTVPLAEQLMNLFATKEYDRIILIYNQFKNAAVQRLITEQYLPVAGAAPSKGQEKAVTVPSDYLFEPDQATMLRELMPKSLRIQLFKALLDSYASEQGARMTAMQKATDNAKDILRDLQISYNKARQGAITKELLEIVSGAEALKG